MNEDDKEFISMCKEHLGHPPDYIKYLLAEIEDLLKENRKNWEHMMPLIGALSYNIEGIVEELSDNNLIDAQKLDVKVESLISNLIKKNKRTKEISNECLETD